MGGIGILHSSGFLSSITKDNLSPWYELQEDNEVIQFIDDGKQRQLNSLVIETEDPVYIQVLPSDYCILVNGYASIDFLKLQSMKVLANQGTRIRWFGNFY